MKIHILGVCGTFMGGIAQIAQELGHTVSGSDANIYPPMSTQLENSGIRLYEGYKPEHLNPTPEIVIIGNAMTRGNPLVESVLDEGLPYQSGPQWLSENVLQNRWVLAVSGTHGKTTTTSLLAWILESAGLQPGFLIGGVAQNFGISARLGVGKHFVVEADEYDTAFFDKRSKFVHYRPKTLIINNLEFDHADIFPDLAAIKRQFHHLIRIVPSSGRIIRPYPDQNIDSVLEMGLWSSQTTIGNNPTTDWSIHTFKNDYSEFDIRFQNQQVGTINWSLLGHHNAMNGLAALAAAQHAGVDISLACQALAQFKNPKRRLEKLGKVKEITVYDDFAHHPTAISATIAALRANVGSQRIIAIFEPRSNSMRMGVYQHNFGTAFDGADLTWILQPPNLTWDLQRATDNLGQRCHLFDSTESIVQQVLQQCQPGDHLLIMSNGSFEGIHQRILSVLTNEFKI